MLGEETKKTAKKTIIELVIKLLWALLIMVLVGGIGCIISVKKKLVQHPAYGEISFWLLLTTITVAVVMLICMVRMYWRYGRFREAFGVLWDKNYNMRCLSCKKPLKHSSIDASILYCADPKCDSKYILKYANGRQMSPQEAINNLKQGSKSERHC